MASRLGKFYKILLDLFRSSSIILKYLWGIKVQDREHSYFWDVVTLNFKKLIDEKGFDNFQNYLDMGCGQIAILGIYVKKKHSFINVTSIDLYKEFIFNARKTCKLNKVDIILKESNLFSNVENKFDCITFNPPYKEKKKETKLKFAKTTFSGKDGLFISKKFLGQASNYLKENGKIFLGINNFFVPRKDCINMIYNSEFTLINEYKRKYNTSTIYELILEK